MQSPEGLDIRAPIGGLFTLLGLLIAGYGLVAPESHSVSEVSSSVNVNLWWGLVMLVFGVALLLMARRAMRR
jgi:hypothetical protein